MRTLGLCIGFFMAALAIGNADAHFGSFSLERRSGQYLVDIGYDVQRFLPDEPTIFSFLLVDKPGTLEWSYAPYDRVDVRIESKRTDVFEKQLPVQPPGLAFLQHEFPKSGEYTFAARYFSGATLLAEADFLINVESDTAAMVKKLLSVAVLIIFLVSTASVATLFLRHRKQQP